MSRTPRPRTQRRKRIPLLIGLLALVTISISLAVNSAQPAPTALQSANPPAAPAPAPHFIDPATNATQRTLVIAGPQQQLPGTSNEAGYLMAHLQQGQLPAGATSAIVRTDTNCQPDQDGISHCLNELEVGTTTITVQHHHNMHAVPCLTPGETVTLMSLDTYQS